MESIGEDRDSQKLFTGDKVATNEFGEGVIISEEHSCHVLTDGDIQVMMHPENMRKVGEDPLALL